MSKSFKALAPVALSKAKRQAIWRAKVKASGLSNAKAVKQAELIPREIVHQFKLLGWPK